VSNGLSEERKKQVIALGQLGWTLRRIQEETGKWTTAMVRWCAIRSRANTGVSDRS
jgi:hypothetical protein